MKTNFRKYITSSYAFPIYLAICVLVVAYAYTRINGQSQEKKIIIEFRFVEAEPGENLIEYVIPKVEEKFYAHPEVLSSNSDIKSTSAQKQGNYYSVFIEFTPEGSKKWAEITGNNIGKRIGILLNNQLVSAPVIRAQISNGKAMITGDFSEEEANLIANGINKK